MLVNRQTINCAFAFSCKKFALFELTDPMRRKIFVQMFLQGEARLIALQVPKERLSGNLTSIGRICSNPLCLAGQYFLTGLWLKSIDFLNSLCFILMLRFFLTLFLFKILYRRSEQSHIVVSLYIFIESVADSLRMSHLAEHPSVG